MRSSWRIARPPYTGDGNWENDLAVIDNVPLEAPNGQWFGFLNATPSDQLAIVVCGYSKGSRKIPELTKAIDGVTGRLFGDAADEDLRTAGRVLSVITAHARAELAEI